MPGIHYSKVLQMSTRMSDSGHVWSFLIKLGFVRARLRESERWPKDGSADKKASDHGRNPKMDRGNYRLIKQGSPVRPD